MEIAIKQLHENEFVSIKDQLFNLQKENVQLSFPDKIVKAEYVQARIDSIYSFLQQDKAIVFLAMEGETVVGFIWCYPRFFYDEQRIFINSLIVLENYRSKNIGKKLVEKVENYAKDNAYDAVDVSAASFNHSGLKFYRNNGFSDERIQLVKRIRG